MQVYSVIVDTDNFNSGLMGVFHPFTKALDAAVDFIKMATQQDRRCHGLEIIKSDLDAPIVVDNKGVCLYINYHVPRLVNFEVILNFKIVIRYPENDQDIIKILTEYKFPFDITFKPWD